MTDDQITANLRPHASGVHVYHPLRGSEDTKPELTREQKETLDQLAWRYDEVAVARFLPNGSALVEATDYEENSHTTRVLEITPSGVPF